MIAFIIRWNARLLWHMEAIYRYKSSLLPCYTYLVLRGTSKQPWYFRHTSLPSKDYTTVHDMRLWRVCASLSVDCHSITSCRPHIQSPKVDTLAPNVVLRGDKVYLRLWCSAIDMYIQPHGHIPIILKKPIPCGPKMPACTTQTFTNTRLEHTLNQAANLLHRR